MSTNGDTGTTVSVADGVITISDSSSATATPFVTFTDQDATPDVSASKKFLTANTVATTITNFDGVTTDGYEILILFKDDLTDVAHSANIDMPGEVSRSFETNDMAVFTYYDGVWYGRGERQDW